MTLDPQQPAATPAPLSIAAIVSLAGAIVLLFFHMSVRLYVVLSASWNTNFDWGFIVGLLGLLSILPIVSGIVFGHLGVIATRGGAKRGRVAAIAGVSVGYVLFVLYCNRLIVVLLAMSFGYGDWARFPQFFMYYI
jgi:hypothetical protein